MSSDDAASAIMTWALLALTVYRSPDASSYLEELEGAAAELERAWELEPGWIDRVQLIRVFGEDGPPS